MSTCTLLPVGDTASTLVSDDCTCHRRLVRSRRDSYSIPHIQAAPEKTNVVNDSPSNHHTVILLSTGLVAILSMIIAFAITRRFHSQISQQFRSGIV